MRAPPFSRMGNMVHALPAMRTKVRPGTTVNSWGIQERARGARKLIELAKAGDVGALKICMDRLLHILIENFFAKMIREKRGRRSAPLVGNLTF
jgi:hypothetical protein